MSLAFRRIAAWVIDWVCILGWVALTAAIGVPLYLRGLVLPNNPLLLNVVAGLVVVVPVMFAAAFFESRRRGATPGKRAVSLRVSYEEPRRGAPG